MMSACKARAPAEGGMMKTLPAQNLYKLIFFEKIIHLIEKIIHCLRFGSPEDSEPV